MNFETNIFSDKIDFFESALKEYVNCHFSVELKKSNLFDSVMYSLNSGGKRYRPLLCFSFAEAFGVSPQHVAPIALSIEMIHTYSLIHDDLPCMDNDDLRRGQPTNHKKFGEAVALLAGDALLTEAFRCLAIGYKKQPELALSLIQELSICSGAMGMILGQSFDIQNETQKTTSVDHLLRIHTLKTGELMKFCLKSSAFVMGFSPDKLNWSEQLGLNIGAYFQLIDDIDDVEQGHDELSVVHLLGLGGSRKLIDSFEHKIFELLQLLEISKNSSIYKLISMIKS